MSEIRFIIFGTGDFYQRYKIWLPETGCIALLDNDISKHNKEIDGVKIYPPECISDFEYDYVYILSSFYKDMMQQLLMMGVEKNKIRTWKDVVDKDYRKFHRRYPIKIYGQYTTGPKSRILLVSSDLRTTGGNIALLYLAQVLVDLQYEVAIASHVDGSLRKEYQKLMVPVIIDYHLEMANMTECEWAKQFNLIIVNTLWPWRFLQNRYDIPVIWWLHEPHEFYHDDYVDLFKLREISTKSLYVYGVSDIAISAFSQYIPHIPINCLMLGMPDYSVKNKATVHKKLTFAIVGLLTKIKGQDIFLNAIKQMDKQSRENCRFLIIGAKANGFADNLLKVANDMHDVEYLGEISHDDIDEEYKKIDVLICASRQETLSMVCLEAMSNHIPCIVSDAAGIAQYLHNRDGWIFPSGSDSLLAKRMEWCFLNPDEVVMAGEKARKLYEDNFSITKFRYKVKNIIEHVLN